VKELDKGLFDIFVIVRVYLEIILPFVWDCRLFKDGLNRANRLTGPAIDALGRVDIELPLGRTPPSRSSSIQSTGQTSTQAVSFTSKQGSAIM
jgi:hypothetical protein